MATINGTPGNDTLLGDQGGNSDDVINGLGGDDVINGGAGNNSLNGGDGDDTFLIGKTITGQPIYIFGPLHLTVDGGAGFDTLDLSNLAPAYTIAPSEFGQGGVGHHTRIGYQIDEYITMTGVEQIVGSQYDDRIGATDFGAGVTTVHGGGGDDVIAGGSSNEVLAGDSGDDTIDGGAGNDSLSGGDGNDIVTGGAGTDSLSGGAGKDIFSDTAAGLNTDTITDFVLGDRIRITDADIASFTFSLTGTTLTFTGGSLTVQNLPTGAKFIASAAASGGVELKLGQNATNDFNGDGRSDILWRHDNGTVSDWLGTANGSFTSNAASVVTGVDQSSHVVGTGDFNGDGRGDILWRNDNGTVGSWLGTANGGFTASAASLIKNVDQHYQIVGIGDFDGDGRSDILWRHESGSVTSWSADASGSFHSNAASNIEILDQTWHVVGTGDFNGDGRSDVLWRNDNGTILDWLGTANGTFTNNAANSRIEGVGQSWHVIGTGDFNGDGRSDILWRNDNGTVSSWSGTANGSFTSSSTDVITGVDRTWHIVDIGDFNGDGRSDILWRNDNGAVADWLGKADGGFANNPASIVLGVDQAWHVQSPDIFLL